eukprot:Gb_32866 [translate_table: standard]
MADDFKVPEVGEGKRTVPYTKEIGDQGLQKLVLKEGESWQTPYTGYEVEVHYTGTLVDGTPFDSSWDKGIPFRFKLGQGQVIKGWDQGIATMKKGERAVLTIPPELAYGQAGSPPIIPPNATLKFDVEMISWTSVKDVCKDGGLLKKIIKEGERWAYPKEEDEVLVKYEVRLEDGTVASKSEEGVEFYVKDGYFCPALGKAVKTMRKGEQATLMVKPQYGFGDRGSKAIGNMVSVPPNSTLNLDLELVSWKTVVEITDEKKVLKKILKEGEGYEKLKEGAVVKVKYTGRLENGTVFEKKGSDEEPFEFIIFEEQVIEGLDRAVMTMKKGEVAVVTVTSDYGYKDTETQRDLAIVPPDSTLIYEVELVSFVKEKESWDMETHEKIEAAGKNKEEGNALFKLGKYWRASKKYDKAAKYIEYDNAFREEEKQQAKSLKITCNLNNAACKLKLKEYKQAAILCSKVVEVDSKNVKALYRRAQAYIETLDLDQAESDIKKALEIDPNNRDVKLEYKTLKEKQKECSKKEAKLYGNMFTRLSRMEA